MKKIPEIEIAPSIFLPMVGLGTWLLRGEECTEVVRTALEMGYRHIDTATIYENHAEIGKGIKGFDREKLFITSKFNLPQIQEQTLEQACDQTLRELGSDYLDLYLLHYPDRSYDIAAAMEQAFRLIDRKKIRAVGVSNFTVRHLKDLFEKKIFPAANQIEFHPYLNQQELLHFCQEHHLHVIAFRSLGKGALTTDPLFEKIGKKQGKTAAQVLLRWLIEQNISVIPKAVSKEHLAENLDLFSFSLDGDNREILDHLDGPRRFSLGQWSDFNYV